MSLFQTDRKEIEKHLLNFNDDGSSQECATDVLEIAMGALSSPYASEAYGIMVDMPIPDTERTFADIVYFMACLQQDFNRDKRETSPKTRELIKAHAGSIASNLRAALNYTPWLFDEHTSKEIRQAINYYRWEAKGRPRGAPENEYLRQMIIVCRAKFINECGKLRKINSFVAGMVNAFAGTAYSAKAITEKLAAYRKEEGTPFIGDSGLD